MFEGAVEAIYITSDEGKPMELRDEIVALAGTGLEGDRYESKSGKFSKNEGPGRNLTLIELEAIEAAQTRYNVDLTHGASRRNIHTRGVPLNHLVGKEFMVGEVRVKGVKLCEPCSYLETITQVGVQEALRHRGGLRADILTDGTIHTGDVVREIS